jgi:hypothetical protein
MRPSVEHQESMQNPENRQVAAGRCARPGLHGQGIHRRIIQCLLPDLFSMVTWKRGSTNGRAVAAGSTALGGTALITLLSSSLSFVLCERGCCANQRQSTHVLSTDLAQGHSAPAVIRKGIYAGPGGQGTSTEGWGTGDEQRQVC